MTLSIITINYNNRLGLQKTIDSVICQTFTDYEWIVIDGGSTDGSRELIEQYADHFAYWCSEPDKGIYNAMNKGIAHAKGEWLQFLNSGDWLYEDTTLEKVFSKEYEADVVYGDTKIVYMDTCKTNYYPNELTFSYFIDHTLCHQASFYNHLLFKETKYDESLKIASDLAMQLYLILQNKRFEHINQIITYFDGSGIGSQNSTIVFHERYLVFKHYIPYHLRKDIDYVKKWELVENRKSFRYLHNIFYKICIFINKPLHKLELWKRK